MRIEIEILCGGTRVVIDDVSPKEIDSYRCEYIKEIIEKTFSENRKKKED